MLLAQAMSRWTHALCDACWAKREPDRIPTRLRAGPDSPTMASEPCCFCGQPTCGIYIRHDPATAPCGGNHPGKED